MKKSLSQSEKVDRISTQLFKLLLHTIVCLSLVACGQHQEHYQGYVEGEDIYLTSSSTGILKELLVKRGEQVKAGELLFKLDSFPQVLALGEAQAYLRQGQRILADLKRPKRPEEIASVRALVEQTEAQIQLAAIRMKRNSELYAKHVIAKDTLDAANERYEELKYLKQHYQADLDLTFQGARLEQINAQLAQVHGLFKKYKIAEWQLAQKSVYAPADGMIVDTYFRVGEYVSNQNAVLSLLTPSNTRIEFFVPVETLAHLNVGKQISYQCDGCQQSHPATVSYISPQAEYVPPLIYSRENNDKLVFRIKAQVKDPANLKPGQPVMVTFIADSQDVE